MKAVHYLNVFVVTAAFLLAVGVAFAANQPTAPDSLTQGQTSTFNEGNYKLQSVNAIAGNVSALVLHAIGQTKAWQGYFGNITATVTLDDANNFTFYNWSAAEPRGQIYATINKSISWDQVECFNVTNASKETLIENYYNIATDDVDGVAETYTTTDHPSFVVASRTMTGCPTSYIFRDDTRQTADFANVLLSDPNIPDTGWIYTTLIENKTAGSSNDLTCYNGQPCDFQILVNEDGHGTDTSTTTYYFWVEIV